MPYALTLLAQSAASSPPGGGTNWLMWGVVLMVAFLALFLAEAFLPSGGILGALAGLCAIGGVLCITQVNTVAGLVTAAAILVALPFMIMFLIRIWPETPIGRWVTLPDEPAESQSRTYAVGMPESGASAVRRVAVGDVGRTLTPLYPVGAVRLGDERIECLARGGMIEADRSVRVVAIDGTEVWVQEAEG